MQGDGNMVLRNSNRQSIWDSNTFGNDGAGLTLDDNGRVAIVRGGRALWTADGSSSPQTPAPILAPTPAPPAPQTYPESVVLNPGASFSRGDAHFLSSPSKAYKVGLSNKGDFVLQYSSGKGIWSAGILNGENCFMQSDGNLLVRDEAHKVLWTSHTGIKGARLVVDDAGQLSVMKGKTPIWMAGVPRGTYQKPPASENLPFPRSTRGAFYYPWFPETWTVNGKQARFEPKLGFYNSGDPHVAKAHIDALEYARVDLSIASWFGPNSHLDRARITLLMDETIAMKSQLKWTVYHEDEFLANAPVKQLKEELDYLKKWFAWHPAWAHIDQRPVIFVYNEGGEGGCDVAQRWMKASDEKWHVVLKVFKDFSKCAVQPDSWHQYGPDAAVNHIKNYSYTVSPGFWRADMAKPKLARVSQEAFCENVKNMVESEAPWQLVTTFNEAGEGTVVEAASNHWTSSSGYGDYLDCLHDPNIESWN